MNGLSGKRALITGASSGLGAHVAKTLAKAGAAVTVAARRKEPLVTVADHITAQGGQCDTIALDVSDSQSIVDLITRLEGFDILVNNAGIVREAGALEQSEADWDAVIDTNLKGMFLMAQIGRASCRERMCQYV